jgi:hypothetical protein
MRAYKWVTPSGGLDCYVAVLEWFGTDPTGCYIILLCHFWPAQEAELKKNNIRYEGHIYPNSVHGFFNDATPERYNKVTAQQAWTRTVEWFNQYVRGA